MDKADRSETSPVTTRIHQRLRTSWTKGNVGHDRVDEIFLVALVLNCSVIMSRDCYVSGRSATSCEKN